MHALKFVVLGGIAALFISAPAQAAPLTCKAVVSSSVGGRLEVTRIDPYPASPELPFTIPGATGSTWYPPASGSSVDLQLVYESDNLDHIGDLSGIDAEFARPEGSITEQYKAIASVENLPNVPLEGVGVDIQTHKYSVGFQWNNPADRAMGRALEHGARIKIVILKANKEVQSEMFKGTQMNLVVLGEGKEIASETFDTSQTAGRDELFAQARHLVETSDPAVCEPTH
jgi:hypothetical protein